MVAIVAATAIIPTVAMAGQRPAILSLRVNEVEHGESVVFLMEDDVLIPQDDLDRAGLDELEGDRRRVRDLDCLSLASTRPAVHYRVDEPDGVLDITVSPSLLGTTDIDVRRPAAPDDMIYGSDTSMFVNYSLRALNRDLHGYAESGLHFGRALAYGTVSFPGGDVPVRGPTYLQWDDRDDLRRVAVGDVLARAGALGGSTFIGGVHLARSFDLDPYMITRPTLDQRGDVLVPSTAEVYVNGSLVAQQELPPGSYRLDDLPVPSGAGEARVVIRDALGRTEELTRAFYGARGLLAPGLSDYHAALGAPRRQMGKASFNYGSPVTLARYRRGLHQKLTAGVRAEASLDMASAGAEAQIGTDFGEVDLGVGASRDGDELGAAGSLSWNFSGKNLGFSSGLTALSHDYSTISVRSTDDRPLLDARLRGHATLGPRARLGLQATTVMKRDEGTRRRLSLIASSQPVDGWTLGTTLTAERRSDTGNAFRAFTTLSFSLGERTRASFSHRYAEDDDGRAEVQRSLPAGSGVGYRISANTGERDRGLASVDAQTDFGRYRAGYQWTDGRQSTELSAAGGLSLIGGRVFATRPVRSGFALVRVPGGEGVAVFLDNREVGRTDESGDLLIPDLQAYYGNQIGIAPLDIPSNRIADRTHVRAAPPLRGGMIVTFPTRAMRLVRGRLRVAAEGGEGLVPSYGELRMRAGDERIVSPIGVGGEFELDGAPSGRWPARIVWSGGTCELKVTVPEGDEAIVDVGDLHCGEVVR